MQSSSRSSVPRLRVALLGLVLPLAVACGPEDGRSQIKNAGPAKDTFAVSDYFAPSGAMGDGATPGHIVTVQNGDCKERPEGARGDCYVFTYTPGSELWGGVYFQYPADNWGTAPGKLVEPVFSKVHFYAAINREEQEATFIVGGIGMNDDTMEYRDSFQIETTETIGMDWKEFSIDIAEQEYESVLGAFAWSIGYPPDTDPEAAEPMVLYIDDLVWEK